MRLLLAMLMFTASTRTRAGHRILAPNIKTLQVVVNQQWTKTPVMTLRSNDVLHVSFDELSHNYHRFVCHLEHCEPDWSPTEGLFESDWLQGFNDVAIEDYENSLNTTVLYTHYQISLPNEQQRLKLSGNYRLSVIDQDDDDRVVLVAEFRVVEPLMNVGLGITANTDVDHNDSHQQVAMTVNYNTVKVTNAGEQLQTFVMQNGREDNMKANVRPNFITPKGLKWEHNRQLIFEAGNEYHKYEILDVSHPTMGLDRMVWDEDEERYHAYPLICEPRRNYTYDEDANGAFYIRNSDNIENDRISDYVWVHYKLMPARQYSDALLTVDGRWTVEPADTYTMSYDESDHSYNATILQKQGYYNYQLRMVDLDGTTHSVPEEGSFYQTQNSYEAYVYYRGTGERTWRLVGYQEVVFKP